MKFLLSLIAILLFLIFLELIDAWSFLPYLFGGLLLSIIPLLFANMNFEGGIGENIFGRIFGSILTFLFVFGIEIGVLYLIYKIFISWWI